MAPPATWASAAPARGDGTREHRGGSAKMTTGGYPRARADPGRRMVTTRPPGGVEGRLPDRAVGGVSGVRPPTRERFMRRRAIGFDRHGGLRRRSKPHAGRPGSWATSSGRTGRAWREGEGGTATSVAGPTGASYEQVQGPLATQPAQQNGTPTWKTGMPTISASHEAHTNLSSVLASESSLHPWRWAGYPFRRVPRPAPIGAWIGTGPDARADDLNRRGKPDERRMNMAAAGHTFFTRRSCTSIACSLVARARPELSFVDGRDPTFAQGRDRAPAPKKPRHQMTEQTMQLVKTAATHSPTAGHPCPVRPRGPGAGRASKRRVIRSGRPRRQRSSSSTGRQATWPSTRASAPCSVSRSGSGWFKFPVKMDDGTVEGLHRLPGPAQREHVARRRGGSVSTRAGGPRRGPRPRHVDDLEVRRRGGPVRRRQGRGHLRPAHAQPAKELEGLARRFATELEGVIGPERDIPAPDVNTNAQVMAWMMDTVSMHRGYSVPGVVTGKPIELGGSEGRADATGQGLVYCVGLPPSAGSASTSGGDGGRAGLRERRRGGRAAPRGVRCPGRRRDGHRRRRRLRAAGSTSPPCSDRAPTAATEHDRRRTPVRRP